MKSTTTNKFRFIPESEVRKNHFALTGWQSSQLRKQLPAGIYWCQIAPRTSVMWNITLLKDYMLNGGDTDSHRALIEEYLSTLPTSV